jgi:hypothetical protein
MAQLAVLLAGLLLVAESQAGDVGFLSKSSMHDYDKFITPQFNRMKNGNGPDIADDKPALHPTTQGQDFYPVIADREIKRAYQKLLAEDSSNHMPLYAVGVGLLSLVTVLGVRLRRGLQSAAVSASRGGLAFDPLGENAMEMKSQVSNVNSRKVGWGQLPSQKSEPLTLCYAAEAGGYEASQALPFMPKPPALDGTMAGDVGFDPFGFSSIFNVKWLREAEIKHGRICMLAWTGFVATDLGFTLPGDMHQVSSVEAHDVSCKYGAMQQIFLWISFIEIVQGGGTAQMMWMGSDRKPGDFGLDPLDFCSTPEKEMDMKTKEITHCRLAMFAFSAVVTQAVLTGKGFPYF